MNLHPLFGAPPLALIRTVARHGGVGLSRLPLLAALVLVSALRIPGFGIERWKMRRLQTGAGRPLAPVFIVGHWRSGTTLLHNLLSLDAKFVTPTLFEALSPAEFTGGIFMPLIRRILDATLPSQRPMDTIPVSLDMPMEEDLALAALGAPSFFNCLYFPGDIDGVFEKNLMAPATDKWEIERHKCLLWFCRKIVSVHPDRRLLLKSPANSTRIRQLKALFPDAQFIHIHRKPEDVRRSTRRLYEKLLSVWSLQAYDTENINRHIDTSYPRFMHRLLDDCAHLRGRDLVTLSFGDLLDAPLDAVKNIYTGLGLTMSDETTAAMTLYLAKHPIEKTPRPVGTGAKSPATVISNPQDWQEISKRLGYS